MCPLSLQKLVGTSQRSIPSSVSCLLIEDCKHYAYAGLYIKEPLSA